MISNSETYKKKISGKVKFFSKIFKFIFDSFKYFIYLTIRKVIGNNSEVKNYKKYTVFLDSGKLGDVVISSIILENDTVFKDKKVIFLVSHKYSDIFINYKGSIEIVDIDFIKYKYNPIYRIKFLKRLIKLGIKEIYNISSARGFISNEIALLSGAKRKYSFTSNHIYLSKYYSKKLDEKYDKILFKEEKNAYSRIINLLKDFNRNEEIKINRGKIFNILIEREDYICISPFSSLKEKNWNINYYRELISLISNNHNIFLIGSKKDYQKLDNLRNKNTNINIEVGDLNQIIKLIANSKLYIGNDSGFAHIALKFDIPAIVIIGGGFFGEFFPLPFNIKKVRFLYHKMECFNCAWNCSYRESYCISRVSVQEVYNRVLELLNKKNDD